MTSTRRSLLRFPVALALLAVLVLPLSGCGGGGDLGGDPHGSSGSITVINGSDFFWPIVTISAPNGSVSVGNVAIGGSAVFTGVAYGSFTVTAFAANGVTVLASGSGTLNSPTLTITLF